ncbi:MAG: glycosyltransferase family 4 protein [Anaerolineae bacterium]|nr:glycosyltransferase family 4 protein [Anaerolineae bacterium]
MNNHNVTFVLPGGLTLSGVVTWSIKLCKKLADLNRPVGLIQHHDIAPKLEIAVPPNINVIRCKNKASPHNFYIEKDLKGYQIDYLKMMPSTIIPNGEAGTYATCALIAQESPDILRTIGMAHSDEPGYYDWLSYYEPIIYKYIAVSNEIAEKLTQLIPHRAEDILIRPYAVDIELQLQRGYSPEPKPIQLMYAGRIVEKQKRVSDLIELVKNLVSKQVNFQLRLVGDGPDVNKLKTHFQTLGQTISDRVTFEGNLTPPQIYEAWQTADVCILVSEYEGTSISMLEAMACGCIPVVTNVSGTKEVIEQSVNGFTVTVGDMAEMACIIEMLDDDRGMLAELGHSAHATILKGYSYDRYVPWFLNLIDEVWQQSPRRWPEGWPLHRSPTLKEHMIAFSGEELSQLLPTKKLIKALGFKVAAHPALKWLHQFRILGKKIVGD